MSVSEFTWILFLVTAFETASLSNSLVGNHVCSRVENYTVMSYETYLEPVVVNTFTWCLQIPPRCPKKRTEMRKRYRSKPEIKSRIIEECCEGHEILMVYDEETGEKTACIPYCKPCLSPRLCTAPNKCPCKPGHQGDDCFLECPSGSWGPKCAEKCDCGENSICNPVNGDCRCASGWQGPHCEERCANGTWGPDCARECGCKNCDPVTGRCAEDDATSTPVPAQTTPASHLQSFTTERARTAGIDNAERTEIVSAPNETTERQTKDIIGDWNDANYTPETTFPATASVAIPPPSATTSETKDLSVSTTARPVIVLVSVPERRRDIGNDRPKFATKDVFLRHVESNESGDMPKIDYVKTVRKDNIQTPMPIPMDIALIIIAAIVSLGLTSVAVVMVLHMRTKWLETVRLAIYDDEKTKSPEHESANSDRMSTLITSSLPPLPIRPNSVIAVNTQPETILTVDGIESLNTYANGAATIGLRVSGNLRDLLQNGHYDRPTSTLIRLQTNLDQHDNTEHVYDEIPLQTSPLPSCKDM